MWLSTFHWVCPILRKWAVTWKVPGSSSSGFHRCVGLVFCLLFCMLTFWIRLDPKAHPHPKPTQHLVGEKLLAPFRLIFFCLLHSAHNQCRTKHINVLYLIVAKAWAPNGPMRLIHSFVELCVFMSFICLQYRLDPFSGYVVCHSCRTRHFKVLWDLLLSFSFHPCQISAGGVWVEPPTTPPHSELGLFTNLNMGFYMQFSIVHSFTNPSTCKP